MILFLRDIPKRTTSTDIKKFITPALSSFLLFKSNKIVNIDILHFYDSYLHTHEYHGLVTLQNYNKRIVNKLNSSRIHNKKIVVREYVYRTWHNDKRSNHATISDIMGLRKTDRRRGKRIIEILPDERQLLKLI